MTALSESPRPRRFRWFRLGLILLFWAVMTGWLIRFEACPERFTGRLEGYRDLIKGGVTIRQSWMKITANNAPVGYSRTEIDVNEKSPAEHYRIESEMDLEMNILGTRQKIYSLLLVRLDVLSRLQNFTFSLRSGLYDTEIKGARVRGDQFVVIVKSGETVTRQILTIPDDVVIHSPLLEQALGAMEPGQRRTIKTLDPASLGVTDIAVRADRRETLRLRGREENAVVLAADYQGMTIWSWVNREGEILKQDTPLGWTMEACTPEEAMAYKSSAARERRTDMLASAAAPADRPIADARRVRRLEVVLQGVEDAAGSLATPRQTVLESGTNGIRLRITAPDWPAGPEAKTGAVWTNDLEATPFIQSADPALVRKAREIAAGATDPAAIARAVNDWVFRNVRKNPAASLPSAAAVLERLEGDCNEHTYLAVGLLRAAGVPARVKAGVVYMDGRFYYHAWVAVRVAGQWVEMDPTFGQAVADATHIAMAEGELANQAGILRYVGKLSVSVVEAAKEPVP